MTRAMGVGRARRVLCRVAHLALARHTLDGGGAHDRPDRRPCLQPAHTGYTRRGDEWRACTACGARVRPEVQA